jgi:hypothetical protein
VIQPTQERRGFQMEFLGVWRLLLAYLVAIFVLDKLLVHAFDGEKYPGVLKGQESVHA